MPGSLVALQHFRKALAIRETVLGRMHSDRATVMGNLGTVLFDGGEWEQAEQVFRQAAESLANSVGREDRRWRETAEALAAALQKRAAAQVETKEVAAALERRREAATLLTQLFGEQDDRVGEARQEVERLESQIKDGGAPANTAARPPAR